MTCTKTFATLRNEYNQSTADPEKKVDITRRHHWFPREMISEKRTQKFHTDDASLLRSGKYFSLVPKPVVTSRNVDCFIRLLVFDMSIEVDG